MDPGECGTESISVRYRRRPWPVPASPYIRNLSCTRSPAARRDILVLRWL